MKNTDKTKSGTLYEAMLRALAGEGSDEALVQLGIYYTEQKDPARATDCFKRAAERGDLWARLYLAEQLPGADGKKAMQPEDQMRLFETISEIFMQAMKHKNVPAPLTAEAFREYRRARGPFYSLMGATVEMLMLCSGALDQRDTCDCARMMAERISRQFTKVPARFPFLSVKDPAALSVSEAVHEAAVALEYGVKELTVQNTSAAARLCAEALIDHFEIDNAPEFQHIDQDLEYDQDVFCQELIMLNSLALAVWKHENSLGLQQAWDLAGYVSASLGKNLMRLCNQAPAAQFKDQLLQVLDFCSASGNLRASDLIMDLAQDGRLVKKTDELRMKILKRLAEGGDNQAQLKLAQRLEGDLFMGQNPQGARKWYLKAAEVWLDGAMAALADFYAENAQKAGKGGEEARLRCAHCLEHGLGRKKDPKAAKALYEKLKESPLKHARLAGLAARSGDQDEALAQLKAARGLAAKLKAGSQKALWNAYLDGCSLECGIGEKADPIKAYDIFIELMGSGIEKGLCDLPDRINRCRAPERTDKKPEKPSVKRFDREAEKCQSRFERRGEDPLDWAHSIRDSLMNLPEFVQKPDTGSDEQEALEAAAALKAQLPELSQYFCDDGIESDLEDPEEIKKSLGSLFKEGTRITLETCTIVSSAQGGFSGGDNLRFLILSKGLTEIKEPCFLRLKAAAIPYGDVLQVLGVHVKDDCILVIMLHNPDPAVAAFRLSALSAKDNPLKNLCKDFDRRCDEEPEISFYDDGLQEAARHPSLGASRPGTLLGYFLKF